MAGMRVVVVATDADGNIDLADLKEKAAAHADGARRADGHVPVDARRVRDAIGRGLRPHPRARRPGLRGRRQPQRARRARRARSSSAPTCRTSTCTRRSASRTAAAGPGIGPVAVRAHLAPFLPGHPLDADAVGRPASVAAAPCGSAGHPADPVGVHRDDGRRRPAPGHAGRDPHRRTTSRTGSRRTSRCSTPGRRSGRARVHPRPAPADRRDGRHRRRRREAADRLRLPRADAELPGRGHAHDRADRVGSARRARPVLHGDDRDPGRDRTRSNEGSGPTTTARSLPRPTPPRTWPPTLGTTRTPETWRRSRSRRCGARSTGRR